MINECSKKGMKPLCDHPSYCRNDGRSTYIGQDHHIAYWPHLNNDGYFPSGWNNLKGKFGDFCTFTAHHGGSHQTLCTNGNSHSWYQVNAKRDIMCVKAPGAGGSPSPSPDSPESCEGKNVPFTPANGVKYTWASPCSGGCSRAQPKCGWNLCSDAQWRSLPEAQMRQDFPCAAHVFDPQHNHCDKQNRLVQRFDNSYNELVFCKNR
jgi:hypothetical protein